MIWESFDFIAKELNSYLNDKRQLQGNLLNPVVAGNVSLLNSADPNNSVLDGKVILSLVNIEEDRISKNPENYIKSGSQILYKNPSVKLNLYCLFSMNTSTYERSMEYLSSIIQFFQHRNVFNHQNSPALDSGIEKLIFDLHTIGFEQMNQLWAMLGGKYFPSVMYKMRMITIDENLTEAVGVPITEINLTGSDFTH